MYKDVTVGCRARNAVTSAGGECDVAEVREVSGKGGERRLPGCDQQSGERRDVEESGYLITERMWSIRLCHS